MLDFFRQASHETMKLVALLLFTATIGCTKPGSPKEIGAELFKIESGHEQKWNDLIQSASNPPAPFIANIAYVRKERTSIEELLSSLPEDYAYDFIFVADSETFTSENRSCLVIDLIDPAKPRFRALPSTLASIENNLNIANLDFADFHHEANPTGIFKGFK